jgi:DNA polymerase III psi subunit
VEELDKHIAALTKLFTISETAGSIVDEHHKVDYFRDSLFGHPLLADILKRFDFEYSDCTTITYAQITAYAVLHLPNLKTAQQASIRVQANITTPDAYVALQQETKQLRDDVQTLMRKRSSDNSNPNNKKQKQKQNKNKT